MRAFAVRSFGEPPPVCGLPVPAAGGTVLIRVRFAGVNPLDSSLLGRLTAAWPYRFVAGIDFAGVAGRVPAADPGLQAGDRVVGMARTRGSCARYTTAAPGAALGPAAPIPGGVTGGQAAALPIPAATALPTIDLLQATAGQQVPVMGAAGGAAATRCSWRGPAARTSSRPSAATPARRAARAPPRWTTARPAT